MPNSYAAVTGGTLGGGKTSAPTFTTLSEVSNQAHALLDQAAEVEKFAGEVAERLSGPVAGSLQAMPAVEEFVSPIDSLSRTLHRIETALRGTTESISRISIRL